MALARLVASLKSLKMVNIRQPKDVFINSLLDTMLLPWSQKCFVKYFAYEGGVASLKSLKMLNTWQPKNI